MDYPPVHARGQDSKGTIDFGHSFERTRSSLSLKLPTACGPMVVSAPDPADTTARLGVARGDEPLDVKLTLAQDGSRGPSGVDRADP